MLYWVISGAVLFIMIMAVVMYYDHINYTEYERELAIINERIRQVEMRKDYDAI